MAMSLDDHYDSIIWVNLTVVIIYIAIKYLPLLVYIVKLCIDKCKYERSEGTTYDVSLLCCIFLVFGKQLESKKSDKKHRIFLQNARYSPRWWQITVLHIVVMGSAVIALGSALDLTLFAMTYVCTEDPNIDCYPQLIGENDTSLNITVDSPIQDCSFWNSDGVSERVTFLCFQKFFNLEQFLAVCGGIMALNIIALRTVMGLLISIKQKCSPNTNSTRLRCVRIFAIIITELIQAVVLLLHLVLGVTRISADSNMDAPETIFLTMNSAEIAIIFGTLATLLWLPWEKYIQESD